MSLTIESGCLEGRKTIIMDNMKSQINELEKRVFFLEIQAPDSKSQQFSTRADNDHNDLIQTLNSLGSRISNLEAQPSSHHNCDHTYIDGMIKTLADIFQDNIDEIFSKMDDFEIQLDSLQLNNCSKFAKSKDNISEIESLPVCSSATDAQHIQRE